MSWVILADGDLTVQATVSEDFTGAIADSINYSIDQLRQLVSTINQTAVQGLLLRLKKRNQQRCT
jgi:methyl-accepting chemotaxis protein